MIDGQSNKPSERAGGQHGCCPPPLPPPAAQRQSELVVARAVDVKVTDDELTVQLEDGRTLAVPLVWYPRLLHGTKRERARWRLIGRGVGIHWPSLDEDISVEGLLAGRRSGESQQSLKRWFDTRTSTRPNKRMQPTARRARRG